MRSWLITLIAVALLVPTLFSAEPKRVLVISATIEFRHPSIPNAERMLRELAARSEGDFALTLMSDDPEYPSYISEFPEGTGERDLELLRRRISLLRMFERYVNAEALAAYDGIFLVSTTGVLPYPDLPALLAWVAEGHAFMGLHAAMDTGDSPDAYMEMLSGGARFAGHPGGGETARRIYAIDRNHPITRDWPDGLAVVDEFYQFSDFEPDKVNVLLEMDFDGERKPLAWTRNFGAGRVFYTALGHRDDVMLPNTRNQDYGGSQVSDDVPAAYQSHILQGIRWALGLGE